MRIALDSIQKRRSKITDFKSLVKNIMVQAMSFPFIGPSLFLKWD